MKVPMKAEVQFVQKLLTNIMKELNVKINVSNVVQFFHYWVALLASQWLKKRSLKKSTNAPMAQWIRRPPTEWEILSSSLSRCKSPYRLTVRTLSLHGRDWSSILHMDNLVINSPYIYKWIDVLSVALKELK